jgi:hypothetical protein
MGKEKKSDKKAKDETPQSNPDDLLISPDELTFQRKHQSHTACPLPRPLAFERNNKKKRKKSFFFFLPACLFFGRCATASCAAAAGCWRNVRAGAAVHWAAPISCPGTRHTKKKNLGEFFFFFFFHAQ